MKPALFCYEAALQVGGCGGMLKLDHSVPSSFVHPSSVLRRVPGGLPGATSVWDARQPPLQRRGRSSSPRHTFCLPPSPQDPKLLTDALAFYRCAFYCCCFSLDYAWLYACLAIPLFVCADSSAAVKCAAG